MVELESNYNCERSESGKGFVRTFFTKERTRCSSRGKKHIFKVTVTEIKMSFYSAFVFSHSSPHEHSSAKRLSFV